MKSFSIVNISGRTQMNQLERELEIEELSISLHVLYSKADKIESQIEYLENTRTCDVCGALFKRWGTEGRTGGVDFYESGLRPVLYKDKELNCICAHCMYGVWAKIDETH
jgi:hypothetical protein